MFLEAGEMFYDHTLVMLFRIVGQVKNQSYRKALSKTQVYAAKWYISVFLF